MLGLTFAAFERMKHVKIFGERLQRVNVFGGLLQRPSPFSVGQLDVNADGC